MAQIKIQPGNTLSGIATNRGTTVDELLRLNPNIKNPDVISAGASLNVPDSPTRAFQQALQTSKQAADVIAGFQGVSTSPDEISSTDLAKGIQGGSLALPDERSPQSDSAVDTAASVPFTGQRQDEFQRIQEELADLRKEFAASRSEAQEGIAESRSQQEQIIASRPFETALQEGLDQFGVPGLLEELNQINEQLAPLQQRFAEMEVRHIQNVENLRGQRVVQGVINDQIRAADREFQIDRALVASQINGFAALKQAVQGNLNTAAQFVNAVVSAKTRQIELQLNFHEDFIKTNTDFLNSLNQAESKIFDSAFKALENEMKEIRKNEEDKWDLILEVPKAFAGQDVNNLDLEDVRRIAAEFGATQEEGREPTASDFQIVQRADGTFVRINKLTGEEVTTGVQGRVSTPTGGVTETSQINFDRQLINDVSNEKGAFFQSLSKKESIDSLADTAIAQGASFEGFRQALLAKGDISIDSEGNVFDDRPGPFTGKTKLGNIEDQRDKWNQVAPQQGGDLDAILFGDEGEF